MHLIKFTAHTPYVESERCRSKENDRRKESHDERWKRRFENHFELISVLNLEYKPLSALFLQIP